MGEEMNMGEEMDGEMDTEMDVDEKMEMGHTEHSTTRKVDSDTLFDYNERRTYFNYNFLKSIEKTSFDADLPVNEILLNLTGNMNRYVWSINGIPLSETDKIKIKEGEVTRITLNNLSMMHHPMHLHGHFFRVINESGEHSPLKHTVNVPPMEKVTIEFYNEEYGDWFFHCHVLYHMIGGMARIFSYDTPRDERLEDFPVQELIDETNHYYSWGLAELSSNFSELSLTSGNIRNEFNLRAETGYDRNSEVEFTYNRYLNDWVRIYAGVNSENEIPDSYEKFNTVGLAGVKYFTPYMFNVDVGIDHQLRPRFRIDKEILLFPRIFLEGEYEYLADFGWVNELDDNSSFEGEVEWLIRTSFIVSRNFSVQANYHSHFGWGGGLSIRF